MTDEPLQFSQPIRQLADLSPDFALPAGLSSGTITIWVLYVVFAIWAIYTLVAVYHWLKYSHASLVAFPAIGAHLFVSFALMSYALSGTGFFTPYLP